MLETLSKPLAHIAHNYATTNVTTAAWVVVAAALTKPASSLEIFNGSVSIIKLSVGGAGLEDANEIPYYVLPGGSTILLPISLKKGARLTARSHDANATTGFLILNFFG